MTIYKIVNNCLEEISNTVNEMQNLYLLREMRSNGEEGGRPVLFLFASLPLQNQSLEVEFRFRLETGNTSKSPSVSTFVFVYLSAVSELYFL